MPNELILYILNFLDIKDICRLSCINKKLKILIDDDEIWKNLCKKKFKNLKEFQIQYNWKNTYKGYVNFNI